MKTVILDLDNCIADDAWRIPSIDWSQSDMMGRYHDYHSLAAFDKVANTDLFEELSAENRLIIMTARPVLYRAATEHWLDTNGVGYDILMMRSNADHRASAELKESQLHRAILDFGLITNEVICAYDDRPDVVAMYRRNLVNAEVRAIHSICAYTKPSEETV